MTFRGAGMPFAFSMSVLISRCAWHRRYRGYPKLLGIVPGQGLHLSFTDGICQKCAERVRADHLRIRVDRRPAVARRRGAWLPGLAAVTLSLVVALVLIARPTHELPPPVVATLPAALVAADRATDVTSPAGPSVSTRRQRTVEAARTPGLVAGKGRFTTTRVSASWRGAVRVTPAVFRASPPAARFQSP